MKFKKGQKVTRFDEVKNIIKTGKVIKVYSRKKEKLSDGTFLGPYPELYDVKFEDGCIERSFLPHGLNSIDR